MAATVRKWRPYHTDNKTISAAITGTGTAIPVGDCRQVSWETTYTAGSAPTTGTIIIEHAPTPNYAGVWNQLDSIDCSQLSAGTAGFGTYPGPVEFIRARFTVNADQNVTVLINGLLG